VGHERDAVTHPAMRAAFGPDCAPPPATHVVDTFDGAAFLCRGQLGMALNGAAGFGSLTVTPAALADFSGGEAVVRFDLSTRRLSSRDSFEVWVTPFDEMLMAPWFDGVDLTGPARRAVVLEIGGNTGATYARLKVVRNFTAEDIASPYHPPLEELTGPDRDELQTFELRMSRTHLRLSLPRLGKVLTDADVVPLAWDTGTVQFLQGSYTPSKGCETPGCGPNTWTLDNVSISPARPVEIVRARELTLTAPSTTLHFDRPAPAGAELRFLAYSAPGGIQVSTDGGQTFVTPGEPPQAPENGHARSYSAPVPAGTTDVVLKVREVDGNHPWVVQGAGLWSDGG
jgi:hypothetical protein